MKNTDLILEPISGRGFWISNLWFWFISQKILKKEIEHFYVIFTLSWIWRPLKHVELPSLGNWQRTSWDRGTSWWRSRWRAQDAPGSPSGTPGAPSAALWWTPCLSENTVDNDFDAWRSFILLEAKLWFLQCVDIHQGFQPSSFSEDWEWPRSLEAPTGEEQSLCIFAKPEWCLWGNKLGSSFVKGETCQAALSSPIAPYGRLPAIVYS